MEDTGLKGRRFCAHRIESELFLYLAGEDTGKERQYGGFKGRLSLSLLIGCFVVEPIQPQES